MSPLVLLITTEQLARLREICRASGVSPDEQVGAMIDLDFEEWREPDDAKLHDFSRSTRFARFAASEGGAK